MDKNGSKHFLICPLNWGLGHASRCIPVIRKLLLLGQQVSVASDGVALELLREEFPELSTFELPSYNIRYKYESIFFNLLLQSPRIYRTVINEQKAIEQIVRKHEVDIIISDNRFGCRSSEIPSIYMTHQSSIEAGALIPTLFANFVHKNWFRRFNECWIPDFMDTNNLAGKLSAPPQGIKSFYIGPLSRFKHGITQQDQLYNAVFILSGPEPQRTYFESLIALQLEGLKGNYLMVRGISKKSEHSFPSNLKVLDLVTSENLELYISQSKMIVCRSGYSSVMDLYFLEKQALLVPTPGQTEQEYLAKHLQDRNLYYSVPQRQLSLVKDLKKAGEFPGFINMKESWMLDEAIAQWVNY